MPKTLVFFLTFFACAVPEQPSEIINKKEQDGIRKEYYQNGQIKSEGNYINDLKEGLHRNWEANGILAQEGNYKKGKANGWMKWFHEKGHLAAQGNMVDGLRHGSWKICDVEANGFCIEAHFKMEKRDGIWKIKHDNGTVWKEQTWNDDQVVAEKCWDEQGSSISCTKQY